MATLADESRVISTRPVKTALHQAILDVRLHQVRLLVAKQYCNVNCKDIYGRTPLMLACSLDDEDQGRRMMKIFLKAGALLDIQDNLGRTALSYACIKGKERIVRLMLKEDALNLNECDNDGNTCIHHASLCGNPSLVDILCKTAENFGFVVDTRNNLGYTPLLLACKAAHFSSAYVILTIGGASVALRDNEFFLNAREWIQRSYFLYPRQTNRNLGLDKDRRAQTAPPYTSLYRENTVYTEPTQYTCRHTKSQYDKFFRINTEIFRHNASSYYSGLKGCNRESQFKGQDSRLVLLEAVDAASDKLPPSKKFHQSRERPVKSAKLRSVIRSSAPLNSLDMKTIFRVYTSQYAYVLQMNTLDEERRRFTQSCDSPTHDFTDICQSYDNAITTTTNSSEKLPAIGVVS